MNTISDHAFHSRMRRRLGVQILRRVNKHAVRERVLDRQHVDASIQTITSTQVWTTREALIVAAREHGILEPWEEVAPFVRDERVRRRASEVTS